MSHERLEEIRAARLHKRSLILSNSQAAYPAEARRSLTAQQAVDQFAELHASGQSVVLAGRVSALRRHGKLVFMDVQDESGTLQWQVTAAGALQESWDNLELLDAGDFIQGSGSLSLSKRGEKTLEVREWHFLSKSIRALPSTWYGLKDREQRYREREVDFLLNPSARTAIQTRGQTLAAVRSSLNELGFIEVETPILQTLAGGAAAEPFVTHHNALNQSLYLRIAPELYLKRLVVGGFEKVFEIGRNFRNEGIDREHNPEFTMLEFYWAYADYEDLMEFAQRWLPAIVKKVTGSETIVRDEAELSFKAPWNKLSYVEALSDRLGFNILDNKEPAKYVSALTQAGCDVPAVQTYAKLVDELFKKLIRPGLIQPTIVYDYPAELVPLAKLKAQDERIVEVFQILVNGAELAKAYSEQNDPVIQREKFEEQRAARLQGDREASDIDEDYLRALEYGMPPVAGFGMGIDRLLWLITNNDNLRDTMAFPTLKPNYD